RHTRFSRDWSSDVCSSDLAADQSCHSRFFSLLRQLAHGTILFPVIHHHRFPSLGSGPAIQTTAHETEESPWLILGDRKSLVAAHIVAAVSAGFGQDVQRRRIDRLN